MTTFYSPKQASQAIQEILENVLFDDDLIRDLGIDAPLSTTQEIQDLEQTGFLTNDDGFVITAENGQQVIIKFQIRG